MAKSKRVKLKDKLWDACRFFIYKRDGNNCFTCGRHCEGSGRHAGHFIPDSIGGDDLRYDERNIHVQCYDCNINKGGWGERYAELMEKRFGMALVKELRQMRDSSHAKAKWTEQQIIDKAVYYQEKLKTL